MKILRDETMQKATIIAFALAFIVAIASVAMGSGRNIDDILREQRYSLVEENASGQIGIISIDDKSIRELGTFPWTRSTHAELIQSLQGSGIDRLAFDIAFMTESENPVHDQKLAAAITESEFPVAIAVPTIDDGTVDSSNMQGNYPIPLLTDAGAEPVSIWFEMNDDGAVEHIPNGNMLDGEMVPSIAGWLADAPAQIQSTRINWSIEDQKLPTYSYSDILKNELPSQLEGMSLIIGADSSMLGDSYAIPVGRIMAGARIHAMGSEAIIAGNPKVFPEYLAIAFALIIAIFAARSTSLPGRYATYSGLILAVPLAQWQFEQSGVAELPVGSTIITMAFLLVATAAIQGLRYFYSRMTQNEGTGIPNLTAMKMARHDLGMTLSITIKNHVDIVSELGSEGRDRVMAKVAQRLEMGSNGRTIYQIDSSTFAWKGGNDLDHEVTQIESLLALLRAGVGYGKGNIDIHASAGIEKDPHLSVDRAVTNAVIASTRATERGISWEIYEANDNEEHWKISVVSEISRAIENEDLWVAYQPKVDSGDGSIIGAEALVRWRHPTRGDVRPDAFIPLLEKANRTDDLTRFMMNSAVRDFSLMPGCTVAVNVSPLMIGSGKLFEMVKEALSRYDFNPSCLTIEVTESERFTQAKSIKELEDIKALGVKISIDDYGMGNSTVNYLKILPADELKIDRSFISNMLTSHSDRIVVGSTIRLAHEMGLKVVAEGVESAEIQTCLKEMGCDFIQGYHTGRPVAFEDYMDFARVVNMRKALRV